MVEINPFVLKEASTEAFVKASSQKLPTGVIAGTDSCGVHSYRRQIMFRGKSNRLEHHYVEIALSETLNREFSCLCQARVSHITDVSSGLLSATCCKCLRCFIKMSIVDINHALSTSGRNGSHSV